MVASMEVAAKPFGTFSDVLHLFREASSVPSDTSEVHAREVLHQGLRILELARACGSGGKKRAK